VFVFVFVFGYCGEHESESESESENDSYFVTVSSKFNIAFATSVQAARSA